MQYISVKGDVTEVNPYAIQLIHKDQCIWLKGQIQAAVFIRGQIKIAFLKEHWLP